MDSSGISNCNRIFHVTKENNGDITIYASKYGHILNDNFKVDPENSTIRDITNILNSTFQTGIRSEFDKGFLV